MCVLFQLLGRKRQEWPIGIVDGGCSHGRGTNRNSCGRILPSILAGLADDPGSGWKLQLPLQQSIALRLWS